MNIRNWLDKFSTDCRLKYNSQATVGNYVSHVKLFLEYFSKYREPKEIPTEEIKEWLLQAKTINTRKQRLCSVKVFYEMTVGMPAKVARIPYPKKEEKLPIVLSQDEVQAMFTACENLKHKVILALLYSAGLRVSELLNLKWCHIDRGRRIINIIAGKGKKDRQVMLADDLIPLLEKYWYRYQTREYVLNGQGSLQYTQRSVLEVMKQLASKAGIAKRVYTHLMRHNAFTHMVESGTDINLIQRLAGHKNVKTTNIYLHISDSLISKINSPLGKIKI
jgi:integrase/recombinase XerD